SARSGDESSNRGANPCSALPCSCCPSCDLAVMRTAIYAATMDRLDNGAITRDEAIIRNDRGLAVSERHVAALGQVMQHAMLDQDHQQISDATDQREH